MKRISLFTCSLLSLVSCQFAARGQQPPHVAIEDSAFQQKVNRLLSFTVPVLDVDSLHAAPQRYQLLDAREREEYAVSHLPGAQWVGYDDFDPKRVAQLPKDAPVVVYCSVGYRSEKVGEQLREAGFTQVYNLYGSLFEWANRGYPLVKGDSLATDSAHTYSRRWSHWLMKEGVVKVY